MPLQQHQPINLPSSSELALERLRSTRILVVGLGNIGSQLVTSLAPLVKFIRLVDRDVVEPHNALNQSYRPDQSGQMKVDATADRLQLIAPDLVVERRAMDLRDLPGGDLADIQIVLSGLDSLLARRDLAERVSVLHLPYIDGAVGDYQARVQVLLPGCACLECSWGGEQYRQIATEYPCHPDRTESTRPTVALSCTGAAAASLMVAQCIVLMGESPPEQSYEINGDLLTGRFISSRRRRNPACRFAHEGPPRVVQIATQFDQATVADLISAAGNAFASDALQYEFRRGVLPSELFASERFASTDYLHRVADRRLSALGLTVRDRVVIRHRDQPGLAHVCFESPTRSER
ncbi:MAG: ThiF family adenylyltransferase [Pirellulaceae bacterium]|nr:ThiF family adenylyltransferase [Pirellulaceae bacterium]